MLSAGVVPLLNDAPVWQAAVGPAIRLGPERPTLSHAEDRCRIRQSPRRGRTCQQRSQAAAEPAQARQTFRSHWAHLHSPQVSPSTLEWAVAPHRPSRTAWAASLSTSATTALQAWNTPATPSSGPAQLTVKQKVIGTSATTICPGRQKQWKPAQ